MKAMDSVGVTFVNTLIGRGIFNGVVNIQLGTLLFSPDEKGTSIDEDLVLSCRLRMDIICAKQLHMALGELLTAIEAAQNIPEAQVEHPERRPN